MGISRLHPMPVQHNMTYRVACSCRSTHRVWQGRLWNKSFEKCAIPRPTDGQHSTWVTHSYWGVGSLATIFLQLPSGLETILQF